MMTDVERLTRQYGDFSLAASLRQPGVRFFGDSHGVIAYKEVRHGSHARRYAIGEPLAASDDWARLIDGFLSESSSVVFANIGERLARLLALRKLYINALGWEAILDLGGGYNLAGAKKQNIRNAIHRSNADGFSVQEVHIDDDDAWIEIIRISDQWLTRRGGNRPENAFITRPLLRRSAFQRVFALRDRDQRVVHVLTLDEMWREETIIGYHANINRAHRDAPKNSDYVILGHLVELLKREGMQSLSLGLCPTSPSVVPPRERNLYTELVLQFARQRGSHLYNFDGISAHKEEFRPSERRPVFLAMQDPWPSLDILGLLRVSNLV